MGRLFQALGASTETKAEKVSRFQHLFPNPQLVARKGIKNSLQSPWMDSYLMVTGPLVIGLTLEKFH